MLRKIASLVILAVLMSVAAAAQVGEHRSLLSVGVSGGVSLSSVDFDPTIRQGQLSGPTMGVTLRYTCEKYFSTVCALQIELNYTQLGWKEDIIDNQSEPLPDTYSHAMSYVQLPLLARLSWGKEERGLMFFLVAGPQVGYLLSDKEKRSEVWTTLPDGRPNRPNGVVSQYDLAPQRSFDYGITAGLGLELNTGIGHFMIEGRYYYGLGDFYNNSKKDPFARSAHQGIMAKATYLFDIAK